MNYRFQVHYYFEDDSHAMNAFVRNRAEKDLLEAIKRLSEVLEEEIRIETEAYQEGGLKELFLIGFGTAALHYLSPSINGLITHYFIRDAEIESLDKRIKEETLKNLQLDNAIKEQELQKAFEDRQVIRHVSNYYKNIDNYEKVVKIGFRDIESGTKEYCVEKKFFKNFVLLDNTTVTDDDDATIEIVSPVLKEGKFKWRGRYLNEKIDFSMGDSKFKEDVIKGKYKFSNGSQIYCQLQISVTYDDFGDEKRKSYSVRKVYGTQDLGSDELRLRDSGLKKQKQKWLKEHQRSLFDFENKNEEKGDK